MYAGDVAERRGATVHRHTWSADPTSAFEPEIREWVQSQVTPLLDALPGRPLLIGKSLGSVAAILAAERSLPAIWLTPLLNLPWVVQALSRTEAPFLLVGGTGDATWNSAAAHGLTPHVMEVPAADHGLSVPGPLSASIAVLDTIVNRIDAFIAETVWPS